MNGPTKPPKNNKNRDFKGYFVKFGGFRGIFQHFSAVFPDFGIIRKVPVRTPQEKAPVSVCPARSSASMGPPALAGAELRTEKAPFRFGVVLSGTFWNRFEGQIAGGRSCRDEVFLSSSSTICTTPDRNWSDGQFSDHFESFGEICAAHLSEQIRNPRNP